MRRYEGKLAGILGTIIIHLIAALIFMSVKLNSVYQEKSSEFLVEFQPEQRFIEDDVVEVPKTLEELFQDDDRFRDIIRNIANPPDVTIDPEEYQDRVKEELIASGQLGKENFIDEQKEKLTEMEEGETVLESGKDEEAEKEDEKLSANEMAALYNGPTRIFYFLTGRHHVELPVPIYKCEGSGVIVVNITVNQQGNIVSSQINTAESNTADPCLIEAASDAVRRTRFNPDDKAEPKQSGSITFQFVAQ